MDSQPAPTCFRVKFSSANLKKKMLIETKSGVDKVKSKARFKFYSMLDVHYKRLRSELVQALGLGLWIY